MSGLGRISLAVIAAYVVNVVFVIGADLALQRIIPAEGGNFPISYFGADILIQCVIEVIAGYVCCAIARKTERTALYTLILVGLVVGAISLWNSWGTEPHWYGVILLGIWVPFLWLGWVLRARTS